MDLYFTEQGDFAVSPTGDLALTDTPWRDDLQQAYIRIMTDQGDFVPYEELGATLSLLYGKPQSPETGELGKRLISAALRREGRFIGKPFQIKAVPTGPTSIRFDVEIISGNRQTLRLSAEQNLEL